MRKELIVRTLAINIVKMAEEIINECNTGAYDLTLIDNRLSSIESLVEAINIVLK